MTGDIFDFEGILAGTPGLYVNYIKQVWGPELLNRGAYKKVTIYLEPASDPVPVPTILKGSAESDSFGIGALGDAVEHGAAGIVVDGGSGDKDT